MVDSRYMLVEPTNFQQIYFRFTNIGANDHTTQITHSLSNPPAEYSWTDLTAIPHIQAGLNKGIASFGYQMNMNQGKETTYYIDDIALYVYPKNSIMFKPSKNSDKVTMLFAEDLHAEELSYTFPEFAELGYTLGENEKFLCWISTDSEQIRMPGETVSYADLNHQSFYPFVQSIDDNAMGYVFDGSVAMAGSDNQSLRYKETIEDDGRKVLHLRTYKAFNSNLQGGKWATDARVGMKVAGANAFAGTEFPIVTYTYKIENAYKVPDKYLSNKEYDPELEKYAQEQPIALSESNFTFWYYKKRASDGKVWIANNGENKLGNAAQQATIDGKYHTLTLNMRELASNSNDPYLKGDVYGFALDPASNASWSSDVYVDSIRAYRFGFTTVTYHTNAPEGAAVVTEVAPDTNRGLGKGYLLTADRPVVEGYQFVGWAKTPDATASEVVSSIDLTEDTTVYAVWQSAAKTEAPVTMAASSVYLSDDSVKNGIRFRADISASTVANPDLREYGFLIARQDILHKYLGSLTHEFYSPVDAEDGLKPLYAEGKAFVRDNEGNITKNIMYRVSEEGDITYVARCVGLKLSDKTQVTTPLTARPYMRYTAANGMNVTLYGDTHTSSLYSVVKSIKDKAESGDQQAIDDYRTHQTHIDAIISVAEATEA